MTTLSTLKPLTNLTFLITRPAHQSQNLCSSIETLGGHCIAFPTVEILPLPGHESLLANIDFSKIDKIIFVSANAVHPVMSYWPMNYKPFVFAIGPGTATALTEHKVECQLPIEGQFTSEGLLALPELQSVAREKIIVFSGLGGRTVLAQALITLGAEVQQIAVYQRARPRIALPPDIIERQPPVDLIISTSRESLINLWQIAEHNQPWLRQQQLLVISPGMTVLAKELGFQLSPLMAANASDHALLTQLLLTKFFRKDDLNSRQ